MQFVLWQNLSLKIHLWTTKQKNSKKCAKKIHKVRTRMGAVRMVCVRNMPVKETADLLVRCPIWVRD